MSGYNIDYTDRFVMVFLSHTTQSVAYPGILFGGGVQQIQLRTEDRENGDVGAVAP